MSTHFRPVVLAASPLWRSWLRRSVRLYLCLDEPGVSQHLVRNALKVLEWQLMNHLLAQQPGSPAATEQARSILSAAQAELLGSAPDVAQLQREMSAQQAICPWPFAALAAQGRDVRASGGGLG
jgi:hypothetical protein